ncbi:hypothetical protein Zmor_001817 [Zophobas morio]|uniref:Uncharacterized protein n=1 Tax=Zophobas morio TaxID=2755281 RepID=A0AA38IZP2_9CUCU|nr:hypothetical protein Zmor_001817 [Zophobas morio]
MYGIPSVACRNCINLIGKLVQFARQVCEIPAGCRQRSIAGCFCFMALCFFPVVKSNASSCSGTWKEFFIPSSCLADSRECFLGRVWQLFTKRNGKKSLIRTALVRDNHRNWSRFSAINPANDCDVTSHARSRSEPTVFYARYSKTSVCVCNLYMSLSVRVLMSHRDLLAKFQEGLMLTAHA